MTLTLDAVNRMDRSTFVATFGGVFEHAPWVADRAWAERPFASLDRLHAAMVGIVEAAGPERQLALIQAHPDLADRQRRAPQLTAFSRTEQAAAGLDALSGDEGERQARLNREYKAKFGFPFVMAVKRSTKDQILTAIERRLRNDPATEFRRALDEIARIGRFRLEDLLTPDATLAFGPRVMARLDALARHSETPDGLTRRYLTPEHRAAADEVRAWMAEAGMAATIDAIGNVVGRYEGDRPDRPVLLLGSHIDTVRDAGKYDGNLGVVAAIAVVEDLNRRGVRPPFAIEVLAFGDEEGVRFPSTLLGSRAVAGRLDPADLDGVDEQGVTVRQALLAFGGDPDGVAAVARRPDRVLGYVELHIEQGPVLEAENLPVGIVTAIAAAARFAVEVTGTAGHAGTVPMGLRRDALAAAAEGVLAVERRCTGTDGLVGTVGRIAAAPGAVNVIPGSAVFTMDIRAADAAVRDAAAADIAAELAAIGRRRDVAMGVRKIYAEDGCRCDPGLMARLERAVAAAGLRPLRLPSGAGHDAMAFAGRMPAAMLFVRCRGGISHNPAESITVEDADTAVRVLLAFVEAFDGEGGPHG